MKPALRAARFVVFAAVSLVVGTLVHEALGHGATAVLFGGRVDRIVLFNLQIYPSILSDPHPGFLGVCYTSGVATSAGGAWVSLGGSLSTLLISIVSLIIYYYKTPAGAARHLLFWLSLWWIDIFTYTLPAFGLRKFIIYGGTRSEPLEAAAELGFPPTIFPWAVFSLCALLLFLLLRRALATRTENC